MTGASSEAAPAHTFRLRRGIERYAGWFLVTLGGGLVVFAVVVGGSGATITSAAFVVIIGVIASLLGLVVVGVSSNESTLTVHHDRIGWQKGFAQRWFARKPVALSSIAGVVEYPLRAAAILIRKPTNRPPLVLLQPVRSQFPSLVAILRERLPEVQWVATDLPLVKLLGAPP